MSLRIRIETARLRLVPLDARWCNHLWRVHQHPVVVDWLFPKGAPTIEEEEARVGRYETLWRERGYGMFAVLDRTSEDFIGRAGPFVTPETGRIEIAWTISPAVHGKGLATEAAEASIEFTFAHSNLAKLDCYLRPDNAASRRVAEKLAFRYRDTRYLYDRVLRYYELPRPPTRPP